MNAPQSRCSSLISLATKRGRAFAVFYECCATNHWNVPVFWECLQWEVCRKNEVEKKSNDDLKAKAWRSEDYRLGYINTLEYRRELVCAQNFRDDLDVIVANGK